MAESATRKKAAKKVSKKTRKKVSKKVQDQPRRNGSNVFKVLALDGGGIKGTYTAAVLDQLQEGIGRDCDIAEYFDLIIGTSTGGIIALGLGYGMKTDQILSIYKDSGSEIFPKASSGPKGLIDWMFRTRYDPAGLRRTLKDIFGNKLFSELAKNIAITSFDTSQAKPVIFRSNYGTPGTGYGDLEVADVALATSAAPTYFPAVEAGETYMIDGGVWANCPAMVGLSESLKHFNKKRKDIRVLSIGTTTEPKFVSESQQSGGIVDWAKPISSTLMHAAKLTAIQNTKNLAGHFQRIDTIVPTGEFDIDNLQAIGKLEAIGRDEVRHLIDEVKTIFFTEPAKYRPALESTT